MKAVVIFTDQFHQVSKQSEVHVFPSEGAALTFTSENSERHSVVLKVPKEWWHLRENENV